MYPLLNEKKVRNFIDTLEALNQFIHNLFFEPFAVKNKDESGPGETNNLNKYESRQEREARSVQAEALDRFFTFFPFWDTKFCEGSRDDSVFLRKQLNTSVPDCLNLSEVLKCETLREVVVFYQQNRESQNIGAFTQEEMYKLEQRGLDKAKAENVRGLISFLSKQSRLVPPELFEYLDQKKKIKIDLRGITLGRVSGISAIFCAVINMHHPITRIDLTYARDYSSGFGCEDDIASVLNLYVRNKRFNLKELQCNGNTMDHLGFNVLYKNLCRTNIEIVSMNNCQFLHETTFLLSNFVDGAANMRILSIEGNNLADNIGALVLQHVAKSKTLKYINVSDNPLDDQSIDALCTILTTNRSLECIEFEMCRYHAFDIESVIIRYPRSRLPLLMLIIAT